ncbi:MAG: E3 binding domain-containing protein, partial [Myxococcales bacterium]|nr:E3 binding domain-containing protein [Myxococcales bacterium]
MPTEIKVPALGESITEGQLVRWLVAAGARVDQDQPVAEIETDKITVEIPAPVAGVLVRQLAEEGATINVGDVVAIVDDGAEAPTESTSDAAADDADDVEDAGEEASGGDEPAVMPAARAEAARAGVDLATVTGTGRGGRILKEDVQRAAQEKEKPAPKAEKPAEKPAPKAEQPAPKADKPAPKPAAERPRAPA